MARITTVIASSHSPFLFQPLDWWRAVQAGRRFAPGAPVDSEEENASKIARIDVAFAKLREVFAAAKPDVMVVFGDDQEEQFDLRNHPAFAVYVGDAFGGYRSVGYTGAPTAKTWKPKTPDNWTQIKTMPALSQAVLKGMMDDGFDPAFMMALPNEELGIGHAFTRPINRIDPEFAVPMVPILVNCLYAPQPSAARCVALARAVRKTVESWPDDLKVAVVGSGGLWHTPGSRDSYIDTDFDSQILGYLGKGDADGAARYFDGWTIPPDRKGLRCFDDFAGGTGMESRLGSGTGETRNWIMAAAVADRPATVVDYIPINASPCGAGFAYWNM